MSKGEIEGMLAEVDHDGSGEVEYPEFLEIMTTTLAALEARRMEEGTADSSVSGYGGKGREAGSWWQPGWWHMQCGFCWFTPRWNGP